MAKVQHTCTGCVPIDASIIDVYVTLVETNKSVTNAEAGRTEAEAARVVAETQRTATFATDHNRAVADHSIAQSDHATAGSDHTSTVAATNAANAAAAVANAKAELVQARLDTADADHTRAEGDHSKAVTDHSTASSDHTTAQSDHTTAGADHTRAETDHSTAASDHTASGMATAAATAAATLATEKAGLVQDKLDRADTDHTRAESDHTTAVSDHVIAGTDHTTATGDHATASSDHTLAGADHTTAAADHTQAASDHTLAAADHTTAGADHTQALADHEVMEGYDTRLTNTETEVSQLQQEVIAKVDDITNDPGTPISVYTTAGGWKLNGNGLCSADADAKMKKYLVTAGQIIYLKLSADNPGVYQFQSAASVPSSGTNENLVGTPVANAVDGFVKVPSGATYLIVSENNGNTYNEVKTAITYSFTEQNNKITDLDQEVNGTAIPFIPDWSQTDKYIKPNGDVETALNWRISVPFVLKAGRILTVKTQGNNACVIASTTDGTTYTPLVSAPYDAVGLNTYTYIAEQDITIALSVKFGLGDVVMQTSMPDMRGDVNTLNASFKTIGESETIIATQSVASGGRLNKTINLAGHIGQIALISVNKSGGSSTMFYIMGTNSIVGSRFEYGRSISVVLNEKIISPLFYGTTTEDTSADFEIKIELVPFYGLKDADKKMFLDDKAFEVVTGYVINTNNSVLPSTPTENSDGAYATGPIREGDILAVKGNGPSQYISLYAFYDKDKNKILSSGNAYLESRTELQIIAPEGAAYFVFNSSVYNSQTDSCIVRSALILRSSIKELQEQVDLLYPTLFAGKTIVCFGDSQTENSDQYGKRYSDYLADYTGANVVSVGIGGTRLSCRATPTATPASSVDGYADLDCPSLIDAVATNDFTIVDAGAEWVRDNAGDDNTPIIARLKAVDWTKVDAVTFLIGTNDWGNEANIGTSGEINKRTVFGAINYIISTLLSAYPNLNVYWFTPIVRWMTPWTDENWGGTLQKAGRTLEQFVELVKTEVAKQNIPVCDMYHTLGWNKFNFGQYFYSTDGTHPTKGYFNIGRKIASFISANRSF